MNKTQLDKFISEYKGNDEQIVFAWNGQHGENFVDDNYEFRNQIIERVLELNGEVPLVLITDIYRALTSSSKEAWSIHTHINKITEMMLAKGGKSVSRDYLLGAMQSFDAFLSTSAIECPKDIASECLEFVKEKIKVESSEKEIQLWELGIERFTSFKSRA